MSSIILSQKKPYTESLERGYIRIPEPIDMAMLDTVRITRLFEGRIIQDGVQYDSRKKEFVVEVCRLQPEELKIGTVELKIFNGSQEREMKYYIGHLLGNTLEIATCSLREKLACLKGSFGADPLQRIRNKLIESYTTEVAKYTEVYVCIVDLLKKSPNLTPRSKTIDFSNFYGKEDTELSKREYKLVPLLSDASFGLETETFTVHGFVIEGNGGQIKELFSKPGVEQAESEVQVPVHNLEMMNKFIRYLYGLPIAPANELEAQNLLRLAELWSMEPLKEICRPHLMQEHLRQGHPNNLPKVEQLLGASEPEMVQTVIKATQEIQDFYLRYLEPYVNRVIAR